MFKDIMLPVDGSHFSELALPLALRIAEKSEGRLHIVRVHTPAVPTAEAVISENYDELVRDWERDALRVALARAVDRGVEATAELLDGPVVPALQSYVDAAEIDLVVMTTHGRSGLKRAVLGSVAEQCVRKTEVPILLLHPRSEQDEVPRHIGGLGRILVPLDGSAESESVLPHAVRLAQLADAELLLARIAVAPFDVAVTIGADALRDYLGRVRVEAETYLAELRKKLPVNMNIRCITASADRAPEGILRCAQEQRAEMIAMATHGRSGWTRIAVGSVAETVLHKSTTPVLLIKGVTAPISATQRSEQNAPIHSGG
ncbi:MAG TPA: universal stress protein [Longimicrobiales bacterium]